MKSASAYLCRIGFVIRNFPQFSLRRLASLSSASPNFSSDEDEVEEVGSGSAVYRQVLRRQRPTSIKWNPQLYNSVSFIGSVVRPVEVYKTKGGIFGAYTFIKVTNPRDQNHTFKMQVEMWEDMAKRGIQHLKQNDKIYVSGCLGTYEVADENGNLTSKYKVVVKELCYVAQPDQRQPFHKPEELGSQASEISDELQIKASKNLKELQSGGETGMENCKNHLDLWQLFFCKPYEWWDKRKSKQDRELPDFKHKYSSENLWLRPDDPPWIKRQLQLLDMEIAEQRRVNGVGETWTERYNNCHHLWQVFFSNPHEWWDNRKNKKNSRLPDFKHKYTHEALWISPNDPPWVKRQLQLLDSAKGEACLGENVEFRRQLSKWTFDS